MSLSCCSLDVIYRQFDSFRYTNKSPSAYKQFALKNLDVHNCNRSAKRSAICSHLMPGKSIEGLYAGRKRLEVASCKLEFVRTLLIDNYDSYTYNIYQELSIVNGVPPVVVRNDDWTWDEICYYLYDKKAFDNIVISPGPGSPKCAADIGISLELLQKCKDIPILGVCLGHQALGYVHGARIVHAPEPVHGRLSEIEHTNCILFHHVPSGKGSGFKVMRYHSLVIDAESLPRNLLPIAWTSVTDTLPFLESRSSELCRDAYESQLNQTIASDSFPKSFTNGSASCFKEMQPQRVLMGIMHSTRPHYGLQFHPESIATCHGRQIFKNFRAMTVDYWLGMRSFSISNRKVHNAGNWS